MSLLYQEIYTIVRQIPRGKVSTYGEIALRTGNIRRSRVVGYAMANCNEADVPCHRVIYSNGELSKVFGIMGTQSQKALLESEGVTVSEDNKVNLAKYLWRG